MALCHAFKEDRHHIAICRISIWWFCQYLYNIPLVTHIHTRHTHTCRHARARTCAHAHAYMHTHTHTCTRIHAHSPITEHTNTHARTYARTHIRTHTHTHTHTNTNTHNFHSLHTGPISPSPQTVAGLQVQGDFSLAEETSSAVDSEVTSPLDHEVYGQLAVNRNKSPDQSWLGIGE